MITESPQGFILCAPWISVPNFTTVQPIFAEIFQTLPSVAKKPLKLSLRSTVISSELLTFFLSPLNIDLIFRNWHW